VCRGRGALEGAVPAPAAADRRPVRRARADASRPLGGQRQERHRLLLDGVAGDGPRRRVDPSAAAVDTALPQGADPPRRLAALWRLRGPAEGACGAEITAAAVRREGGGMSACCPTCGQALP